MGSTARFLLGGALGAALGFLISQRNLEKALKGAQATGAPTMSGGASSAARPASEDMSTVVAAPSTARPAAPARPTAVPTWPAAAPSRPAPPPAPQVPSTPTTVDEAPEAPVVHEPAWRIAAAPPLAPELTADRVSTPLAPAPPLAPEPEWEPEPVFADVSPQSEVIVTREFLEEPVPGSGWGSKATPAMSEDGLKELQDMVPLITDAVLPYAGPEIESLATDARASRPTLVWPEPFSDVAIVDLSTVAEPVIEAVTEPAVELLVEPTAEAPEELLAEAPEALVAELSTGESLELEKGVDGTGELVAEISGPGTIEIEALVKSTQFPQAEVEELADEELAGAGQISLPPEPEPVILADEGDTGPTEIEALAETALGEPVAVELPVVDEPVEDLVVEETPIAEVVPTVSEAAAAVTGEPPVDVTRIDDLKARIEETRRRIRHELEQPFETDEEVEKVASDWTVLPAVPATSAPADLAPGFAEPEARAVEPEAHEFEVIFPGEPDEPVDYESMKSRIEQTRSRLKAKAFDAMMAGESALLGREAEGSDRGRNVLPAVDIEVDETIESSLREEED